MSRVSTLIKARKQPSVKFMEFTRIIAKNKVAFFFEGEDLKYYSVRIDAIRPDLRWAGVDCGGKDKVLTLREDIKEHPDYYMSPCLFFVDSDFDDNSEVEKFNDTYITPCYSIENLYISTNAFEKIMESEFKTSPSIDNFLEFEKALEAYESTKESYLEKIRGFNYIIRELRCLENKKVITGKLNLNDLPLKDLVSIDLGCVTKNYDENNPHQLFSSINSNITFDLKNSERYFSTLSPELWFRGKQHLDFFRSFLVKLINDRNAKNSRKVFTSKGKVKLNLTHGNCISELSQYADTPECLVSFLRRQSFS